MEVDFQSCARLLHSLKAQNHIYQGKQCHLLFLKRGVLGCSVTLANRLLQMYARCGHMNDARKLFDEMSQRNCFSWNTMIEGYLKSGKKNEALQLFRAMPHKNGFSWDVVVSGLAKVGELVIARELFDEMPRKSFTACNAMIRGYARNGCSGLAMRFFKDRVHFGASRMDEPLQVDGYVLTTVIGACTDLRALEVGKQVHARIFIDGIQHDPILGTSLVNMYGKCGDFDSVSHIMTNMQHPDEFCQSALISAYGASGKLFDARQTFDAIKEPSIVLCNSMIVAYITNGKVMEALLLFMQINREGVKADPSTIANISNACSFLGVLGVCQQIHAHACKIGVTNDLIAASKLIDTYGKCGRPNDACNLFNELGVHDTILLNSMITIYCSCGRIQDAKCIFENLASKSLISWNSIIVGLSQNGCPIEALDIFCRMNKMELRVDEVSLASAISATASICHCQFGEQVFAKAVIMGLNLSHIISTSLIDLYCKCGLVREARKLFDEMVKSDEVSWNSMLMGYATNGSGTDALSLFSEMIYRGVLPTEITFTGVLSACAHCGFVEDAEKLFYSMKYDYHIDPGIEHYSCMIDLYSRAGRLGEASNLIQQMPFEADASLLLSVLRGCVMHGNEPLAIRVAEKIMELDPENSGAFVQLSSMFSTSKDWEGSATLRKLMKEKRILKNPGRSWTEL